MSRPALRHPVKLAGPLAGMAAALWLALPVFGSRPPAGEDVMAHLVRADFGIAHLVNHGRLDGWFPRFVLGHQEFLFNGPGVTWLVALVRGATLGSLSTTGALKLVAIGSFLAVPPAVWFLARSYGLGRRAAGLAAVFSVMVSSPFGPGVHGLFGTGLIGHQVGAPFFCLALGAALRVGTGTGRRWVYLLAVSVAGLAVTHLLSLLVLAVILGLTLPILTATGRLGRAGLARLAAGGLAGAGLCAFWLVPFLAHRGLQGAVTTWNTPPLPERLQAIFSGELLLPAGLAVAVVAGWGWQLGRVRGRPAMLAWLVVPGAYVLIAHGALRLVAENDVTVQLANRGLGYAAILALFSTATVLAALSRNWAAPAHLGLVVAVSVAAVAFTPGRGEAGQLPEPIPALRAAAGELARLVPDGARFATERDYPVEVHRTGVVHPETWLARVSGRNSLNGFNVESSSTPRAAFAADRLPDWSPDHAARRMALFGVTHVVTTSRELAQRLTRSDRFVAVWQSGPLTILAVGPAPGQPPPAAQLTGDGPLSGRLVRSQPEHLAFELAAPGPVQATVALAWSPKWHARLDGRPVRLRPTREGLVGVEVPAGSSRLRLDYRSDGWDRLGAGITLATGLAGVANVSARRVRVARGGGRAGTRRR